MGNRKHLRLLPGGDVKCSTTEAILMPPTLENILLCIFSSYRYYQVDSTLYKNSKNYNLDCNFQSKMTIKNVEISIRNQDAKIFLFPGV